MSLKLHNSSINCSSVLIHLSSNANSTNHLIFCGMKTQFLFFFCVIVSCFGVRLNPLENNDKLQDINNLYLAEWQWESWPVKQELSGMKEKSPGQRKNVALWRDVSKTGWYLFGGLPVNENSKKVFSDVWKFTVKTRDWVRLFSPQDVTEGRKEFSGKKGELTTPPTNILDTNYRSFYDPFELVLCGETVYKNTTKNEIQNLWNSFRKKKVDIKPEPQLESLAIYSSKNRPTKVMQINVKEKLWTSLVCLNKTERKTSVEIHTNQTSMEKEDECDGKKCPEFDTQINDVEDIVESEQEHLNIQNLKNKKINQTKKPNDKIQPKKIKPDSKEISKLGENLNGTKISKKELEVANKTKVIIENNKMGKVNNSAENGKKVVDKEKIVQKISDNCPEFDKDAMMMSWCDGRNGAVVTTDFNSSQIIVWVFTLKTGLWSELQINTTEAEWPKCSTPRYAGNEEDVYIICSTLDNKTHQLQKNSTNNTDIPSKNTHNIKLVYNFNYKKGILRNLGEIRFSPFFNSPEGNSIWRNSSSSILEVFKNSQNQTILILAYSDVVDLWILNENDEKPKFDLIEKVWRGSAQKWFSKYNSALYSFQFVYETGASETILLQNPRTIAPNKYWPRERGRFIIRIFKNENFKNQTFENRTKEQNLTFQLLQSDYKPPGGEHQLSHVYSLKVLVFFGISLAIFTVFGFVIFLKRCVNCPPKIRVRNDCQKFPVVIRYSVIPEDLMYPVA